MEKLFMTAGEVAEEMGVSKSYAYKVIKHMNEELEKLGRYTVAGKVNRKYFLMKTDFSAKRGKPDAGI